MPFLFLLLELRLPSGALREAGPVPTASEICLQSSRLWCLRDPSGLLRLLGTRLPLMPGPLHPSSFDLLFLTLLWFGPSGSSPFESDPKGTKQEWAVFTLFPSKQVLGRGSEYGQVCRGYPVAS